MKIKKYVMKCTYCNSVFTTTDENLSYVCPHCGGSNDQTSILETIEEEQKQPKQRKRFPFAAIIMLSFFIFFMREMN